MPALRQREQALQAELESLSAKFADQAAYLRLAQTLSAFLGRLRENVQTLDVAARQRIVRLLVKEVVVGHDSITIRHSIPTTARSSRSGNDSSNPHGSSRNSRSDTSYALCTWGDQPALRRARFRVMHLSISNTPALSHLSMSLLTTPSVTLRSRHSLSLAGSMLSKYFRRSTSNTIFHPVP